MEYAKLSRRSLLGLGALVATGVAADAAFPASATPLSAEPADAWQRLVAGNKRFAAGRPHHPRQDPAHRARLVDTQHPFACVLGCADSRVPAELVFDQGLGDLFTVRAVGEVLDDAVVGSVEYAVEHLHVPLLVVLGHSGCGAVRAAISLVDGSSEVTGPVDTVARAIEATVRATPRVPDEQRFLAACVRNQTTRVADELTRRSHAVATVRPRIITAVYDLRTGLVARH
ncbi:carbonic anhydrase [Actinophytocola glycyrrhizae]|uniref:Carbonic anhydrase n=1 Tax=Actinophytocola glycyrrhizae TaxID=2044873 RepID=A0ABV9RSS1_9PSEU